MDKEELELWRGIEQGDRDPSWALLAAPIARSGSLTAAGKRTAAWAIEQIAEFFGERWLVRSFRDGSPLMTWLWSSMNDAPHTHLRRIELGARLALLKGCPGWRELREVARRQTAGWGPTMLQLEVGGLAQARGFVVEFEPLLPSGKRGDLLVSTPSAFLVEATTLGPPSDMQEVGRFTNRALLRLQRIALHHDVTVTGSVEEPVPDKQFDSWLREVESVARRVSGTGGRRPIASPGGGQILLIDGPLAEGEQAVLTGPTVTGDEWRRLASRIEDKATQGASEHPLWIRIDEGPWLWNLTAPAAWPRPQMHAALAANIRQVMAPLPHVTGVVISSPPVFGAPGGSVGAWELTGQHAIGSVSALGQNLHREIVLVSGQGREAAAQLAEWWRWYAEEAEWLDSTLQRLGHPRQADLFRSQPAPPETSLIS